MVDLFIALPLFFGLSSIQTGMIAFFTLTSSIVFVGIKGEMGAPISLGIALGLWTLSVVGTLFMIPG